MPTGNEYSDVRFGQQDQTYKQTDRQMSGGVEGQVSGPTSSVASGSYPNTFDREAGSEPTSPQYYPEDVFNPIHCTGPSQSYVTSERESVSGEYGQSDGITNALYPGTNMVPSPTPSKQFSSDCTGNPKELLSQTRDGITRHAAINEMYGLTQPVATLGSHPWLRDELTNTGESEAGNAAPDRNIKVPKVSR